MDNSTSDFGSLALFNIFSNKGHVLHSLVKQRLARGLQLPVHPGAPENKCFDALKKEAIHGKHLEEKKLFFNLCCEFKVGVRFKEDSRRVEWMSAPSSVFFGQDLNCST